MPGDDPRVPDEVEQYLIALISSAGALGGAAGGSSGGGSRGGAWAARRLRTVVVDRSGTTNVPVAAVFEAMTTRIPHVRALPGPPGALRLVVPLGTTGLQQVVVDIALWPHSAPGHTSDFQIRAYAKEGLLSRHPTQRTADQLSGILTDPS